MIHIEPLKKIAYEKYKLNWMSSRGYTLKDINELVMEWSDSKEEIDFEGYVMRHGFHGELWKDYMEFLDEEYQNTSYMESILSEEEFEKYWKKSLITKGEFVSICDEEK